MTNNNTLSQTDKVALNFYSEYYSYVENFGLCQLDRSQRRIYKRGQELLNDVLNR